MDSNKKYTVGMDIDYDAMIDRIRAIDDIKELREITESLIYAARAQSVRQSEFRQLFKSMSKHP